MEFSLIIPAFIAGVLTFLAPCTLPLVPGYLGFISGVSAQDLQDLLKSKSVRRKIFLNGLLLVVGFSFIFILLGSLFGLGGSALVQYRIWLSRIGGIFVILFGLFMVGVLRLPFLNVEKHMSGIKALKPGNPASSLIFGATFAFGWTPCVGPILGSILTLAAASATVGQGSVPSFGFFSRTCGAVPHNCRGCRFGVKLYIKVEQISQCYFDYRRTVSYIPWHLAPYQ